MKYFLILMIALSSHVIHAQITNDVIHNNEELYRDAINKYILLKKQKRIVDTVYIEDMSKGYSYLPSRIENVVIVRCNFNFIKNKLKKGGFGIRTLRAIELGKDGVSVSVGEYAAYKKKKRVNYDKGLDYQVFYRYSEIEAGWKFDKILEIGF